MLNTNILYICAMEREGGFTLNEIYSEMNSNQDLRNSEKKGI